MGEDYGFVIGLGAQGVAEDIDVGSLTERKFEFGNVGSDGFCDLGESDAEESDDDGEDFISGETVLNTAVSIAPVPDDVMK